MSESCLFLAILMMVLANYLTRATPFLFFHTKKPPKFILMIERSFPPIIMVILVFYSLKFIDFQNAPYGANEIIAVVATILLHVFVKNYLVSIFGATILYMYLVQI